MALADSGVFSVDLRDSVASSVVLEDSVILSVALADSMAHICRPPYTQTRTGSHLCIRAESGTHH